MASETLDKMYLKADFANMPPYYCDRKDNIAHNSLNGITWRLQSSKMK